MMRNDVLSVAVDALGGTVDQGGLAALDVAVGAMTTYRVGGCADIFVSVRNRADLKRVAVAAAESELPLLVVGRGSNLLIADAGFRGIALSISDLPELLEVDQVQATVAASAGLLLPVVARRSAAAGLTGFEWAVGVPGSIGGAVRMNAGGHGSDIASSLVSVVVFDLGAGVAAGEEAILASDLGLRFRGSDLSSNVVVLEARLQLATGDQAAAERQISEIVGWRRENQPGGQNAGSVFVNPVPGEVSAGALIDDAGLRGLRVGSASVSEKHANFIQADAGGSADDVRDLMRVVRSRVEESSGYALRSEIRLIGFADE